MKLTRSIHLNPFLIFIIPLVDLFFLLLLLFLISSTFLLHPGISVNLPFSKFTLGPQNNPVIVSITADPLPLLSFALSPISHLWIAPPASPTHAPPLPPPSH